MKKETPLTSQSIRKAINELQGFKSEPLIHKINANKETIKIIKQQFPSRIKDNYLTYMYGIQVSEMNSLEFGVVKFDFNDGSYSLLRIANPL